MARSGGDPGGAHSAERAARSARGVAPSRACDQSIGNDSDDAQGGVESVPVVISADRNVRYESVVKVMDALQRAGIQRVGLSVKSQRGG